MRLGWNSVRVAGSNTCLSLQPGGKQHHSRELLMMGIVMLETC